jgi:hypothetical protein
MNPFGDIDWEFWGVIVAVFSMIVSVGIVLFQQRRKRLMYIVLSETPLLSVSEEIKGKIKITYGRKSIQNIYLLVLKIENKGNVDIAASDYEQPIIFSFEQAEMLSAEIVEVSPKNLKPVLTHDKSMLTINPILLNRKDYIVIKLLFSRYDKKIDVDVRIIGIKEMERGESGQSDPLNQMTTGLLGIILVSFSWLILTGISNVFGIDILLQPSILSSLLTLIIIVSVLFFFFKFVLDAFRYFLSRGKQD